MTTHRRLDSRQVSGFDYNRIQCLNFALSAPGESPSPPPRNTHGTILNIRRVVSEAQRDIANTQTVVYDIHNTLKNQEGAGGQPHLVSVTRTVLH